MRHLKKLASLLLALAMIVAMSATVFATEIPTAMTGTLTVNNTVKDADYTIYRLLDLESYAGSESTDAHSYTVSAKWAEYFKDGAEGRSYFDVDTNGYVTAKEGMNAAEFAQKALEYAKANNIENDGTKTGTGSSIKFDNLALGYYLVDSSVGALCALTTTDPNGVVIEKNAQPSLDKKVQENSEAGNEDGGWKNRNDANVGETVKFKATITVEGIAKSYVLHDTMDDGLTFSGVTSVTLSGKTVDSANYTVTKDATHTGADETTVTHTFDVTFTEDFCKTLKSGDVIVVYYEAVLNDKAVVKAPENNKAHLSYKDASDVEHETPDSETKTYTWGIPVLKYANGDTAKVLANAKFSLFTDEACSEGNIVKFTDEGNNVYRVDSKGSVTEITTPEDGKFVLKGLDAGTYYLKETEAPAGYNKLGTIVKVTIDHEGKITVDDSADKTDLVKVNNNSGTELPSTGGTGTTIFYVLGSILVIGAGVLLVTKKRMNDRA